MVYVRPSNRAKILPRPCDKRTILIHRLDGIISSHEMKYEQDFGQHISCVIRFLSMVVIEPKNSLFRSEKL